ncbi:hypothetical protein Mgra_00003935, partial [Meloidogyne graminicola]
LNNRIFHNNRIPRLLWYFFIFKYWKIESGDTFRIFEKLGS